MGPPKKPSSRPATNLLRPLWQSCPPPPLVRSSCVSVADRDKGRQLDRWQPTGSSRSLSGPRHLAILSRYQVPWLVLLHAWGVQNPRLLESIIYVWLVAAVAGGPPLILQALLSVALDKQAICCFSAVMGATEQRIVSAKKT